MKRILYIIILFFLITFNIRGQVNLVINPSFEVLSSCPSNFTQISHAIGWDTLRNGGGITPDLFNSCCLSPNQYCGVPINWWNHEGFQFAKSGNGYAGFAALYSYPQVREFIQGSLIHKLTINNDYCIKAYINLSDFSQYSINSLGFYLDDGQISCQWNTIPNIIPQVFNTGQQLSDTINWIKIEGIFTATGSEEYISIGNFFPDSLSSPFYLNPLGSLQGSYYYIDDVSVINTNLSAYAGKDTLIHAGDSVFIGRQPEIGLDEDCIWFVDSMPIDTIAGMWVKPDSTTTYILEQTICGNVSYDTVTVIVYGTGIESYTKDGKGITLYPNPATNTLNIESISKFSQVIILDILGNVVIRQMVYNHAVSVDVSGLGKGVYFVKMVGEKGFVVRKFLKE